MSLSTGLYTIRSAAFEKHYVGCSPVDGGSTWPKPIVSIPSDSEAPQWSIENLGNGRYYLKTEKTSTALVNNLVFAVLGSSSQHGESWDLKTVPQYGDNQYLIQTYNDTAGWVLPDEDDYTQVAAVHPSNPTQYPPNQRWIIESLEDLD